MLASFDNESTIKPSVCNTIILVKPVSSLHYNGRGRARARERERESGGVGRERERERERETDRQTDRQKGRETDTQTHADRRVKSTENIGGRDTQLKELEK